jgi:transcriptional adapter 3
MAPLATKSKGKVKDGRQSRSRHTTPSSVTSLAISSGMTSSKTAYLETALGSLMVPTNVLYDDILKRHGPADTIPDSNHLETLANDLDTLSQLATTREDTCDGCMRLLSVRRRERVEEEREEEQARRDAEEKEKASLKRVAEDDEIERGKATKIKKKKEKSSVKEDRPLAVGAHGLARQDGKDANGRLFLTFLFIQAILRRDSVGGVETS